MDEDMLRWTLVGNSRSLFDLAMEFGGNGSALFFLVFYLGIDNS